MAEIVEFVVIPLLYLAALLAYAGVAPVVVALRAAALVGELLRDHVRLLVGVIHRRTPDYRTLPEYRPQDDEVPARRNYFFGPGSRDLWQVAVLERRGFARTVARSFGRVTARQFRAPTRARALSYPWGLTLYAGLAVGTAAAVPVLLGLLALHAAVLGLLNGAARTAAALLRTADRVLMWVRRLGGGMMCQSCYEYVGYPEYDCPGDTCRRRHTDIRPGTFGIVRRRCACGQSMPTLLMLMSREARLAGYCTHAACRQPMTRDTGHMPEVVLPLVGGQAAGKTQLMAAMVLALENAAARGGRPLRPSDEPTADAYAVLRDILRIRGNTRGTRTDLPRAHSFVLGVGRRERLVHLFDAAGERFTDREGTDPLRYSRAARTLVFVLDPMSVDAFWTRLDPPPGPHVDRTLASTVDPEHVFSQFVNAMGGLVPDARLAVAVTKTDLLPPQALPPSPYTTPGAAEEWLRRALGLGNLLEGMDKHFRDVRFFFTAAVADDEAAAHPSIAPLADWCLNGREPFRGRRGRPGPAAGWWRRTRAGG